MKILITGSDGMLGSAVNEVFKDEELLLTDIHNLDVTDYDQVISYADSKPDLIIHLAAETDLEKCQRFPEHAYMTNHTGTVNVMLLAKKLDIPMVFISTAGIFNGQREFYHENCIPDPINHYGRSKWFAEIALSNYDRVWIFRAGWMMGGGPVKDKKFVGQIYRQLFIEGKKDIYAIDDIYGSPTYTHDLAETIKNVINNHAPYGVYNCAGEGKASRYDVAKAVVEFLKADAQVIIVPVDYFQHKFPCPRSKYEVLKNWKLNDMGLSKMRDWEDSLKEYIEKCYTF